MIKVTLTRVRSESGGKDRYLSLGEYYKEGTPQEALGARKSFLLALQKSHQKILTTLRDRLLPEISEIEFEVFEEIVYSVAYGRTLDDRRVVLNRAFSNKEREALQSVLVSLEEVLAGFNLNVPWVREQALVSLLNWLSEAKQAPQEDDLPPDFPVEEGQLSWIRLPTTWTIGTGDCRHEWPESVGDFRFWLAQKPPAPDWAESHGVEAADGYAWDPVWESREDFEIRATAAFQASLSDYTRNLASHVEASGYAKAKNTKRKLDHHTEWLARYQVGSETWQQVADFFGLQVQSLKDEMKEPRELLKLPERRLSKSVESS